MSKKLITIFALSLFAVSACKSGYNKRFTSDSDDVDAPECEQTPSNSDLIDNGVDLLDWIALLTCDEASTDGVIMGQNTGSGDEITGDGISSYSTLITTPFDERKPTLVSIDYEHEKIFTAEALSNANAQLKAHWDAGGIIMISWTPLNPWSNDASDPENSPGTSADLVPNNNVDLAALLVENSNIRDVWLRKLDAMADALQYFADNDIPVLWRPLPAPNTTQKYWWGLNASYDTNDVEDATLYTDLWQDMYNYLTNERELDHLLWVYSPAESGTPSTDNSQPNNTAVAWAYPGNEYVDVVGAIAQNDNLNIPDYDDLNEIGKPLGMAQYNPYPSANDGNAAKDGSFDNMAYAQRLEGSFEHIAFWVTWHSYNTAGDIRINLALKDNIDYQKLADDNYVLDLKTVKDNALR